MSHFYYDPIAIIFFVFIFVSLGWCLWYQPYPVYYVYRNDGLPVKIEEPLFALKKREKNSNVQLDLRASQLM